MVPVGGSFPRSFRRNLAEHILVYQYFLQPSRRNDHPCATREVEKLWLVRMVDGEGTAGHTPVLAPALSDIGMIELLECDSRPTFILDLERAQHAGDELLHTVFSNASVNRLPRILCPADEERDIAADDDELEQYSDFKKWATSSPTSRHTADWFTIPFQYHNISWTCSTLRKRWRIISGSAIGLKGTSAGSSTGRAAESQKDRQGVGTPSKNTQEEKGKPQTSLHPAWVDELPSSEHIKFFKNTDWSATALGPLETWSSCLRQMTRLLMSDSRAAAVFWYRPATK